MMKKEVVVEIASLEWAILERAYTLVAHLRQVKMSQEQKEIAQLSNHIEYDIQGLQDMLRVAREETKAISGMQPASRSTDLGETSAMAEDFRQAAHQRATEGEMGAH